MVRVFDLKGSTVDRKTKLTKKKSSHKSGVFQLKENTKLHASMTKAMMKRIQIIMKKNPLKTPEAIKKVPKGVVNWYIF